jgi:hypothetical protein
MNDLLDRKPQNRVRTQLEAARTAGAWMPWAGLAIGVLLSFGILIWAMVSFGFAAIFAQPAIVVAGGLAAIFAPGVALVCAGVMARESARSAEANAVVLTSARMLLEPSETVRDEIATTAQAVARETEIVSRVLADTHTRLAAMKGDIEMSVVGAIRAAELVRSDGEALAQKMASERQSMTQLAESLRNQSESLAKAIPRHAQMLSEAARAAQDQVRKADETLDARLRSLEDTAAQLSQRISQLDTMGAESRKRAQNLGGALMRLDEQLVQSTRMVESATKAGELAAAATRSTAESLRDAVSDALGSALKATETINSRAAQAATDAQEAMLRLKEIGLQTEATTKAATIAAQSQAADTEQRISQLSEFLLRAANKATTAAEQGLERARHRIEQASQLVEQMKREEANRAQLLSTSSERRPLPEPEPLPLAAPPRPAPDDLMLERPIPSDRANGNGNGHRPSLFVASSQPEPEKHRPSAPKPTASGGFDGMKREADAGDELVLQNITPLRRPASAPASSQSSQPLHVRPTFADPTFAPSESMFPAAGAGAGAADNPNLSWRDLLSGIEDMPAQMRDNNAGQMIDRLDRAGVQLGVVKASDLRRIASAAHQGERHRRRAIRDVAPVEIQRVARLLDSDRDLQNAARSFIHSEEPEALRTLATAERAREDAHPRLSAYLLLDAALGATA